MNWQEAKKSLLKENFIAWEIGNQVRLARKKKGLTQTELASKLGTQQSHIARLENGAPTSLTTLSKVADALGMELEVVFKDV